MFGTWLRLLIAANLGFWLAVACSGIRYESARSVSLIEQEKSRPLGAAFNVEPTSEFISSVERSRRLQLCLLFPLAVQARCLVSQF